MRLISQAIITSRFEETIEALRAEAKNGERFEIIVKEDKFLIEDASLAIEKAYMASSERTIIILAAGTFPALIQNKLLKVIEEPPPNKEFILMTPSKATILPTIRSRLPVVVLDESVEAESLELDLDTLNVRSVYEFVQANMRIDALKAKKIVQSLLKEAVKSGQYNLDEAALDLFRDAVRVLGLGSPPSFVLTGVLLKLLARKKKRPKQA